MKEIKFIDLFSGMGGIRIGFEQAIKQLKYIPNCILTSEIKPVAIETLKHNFKHNLFYKDIRNINIDKIPDFDFLLGGFPCQTFSAAGNRDGFYDTRGTLFFEVEKILKIKKPKGFILENVEGLVKHDLKDKKDSIGNTLRVILETLKEIGYKVSYQVLNASDFGLAQNRKRIYIVGSLTKKIELENFKEFKKITFNDIQEKNIKSNKTNFIKKLLKNYNIQDLYGKKIKDKRGGENNIHSWDFGLKGEININQKQIMGSLLKERRKKHWAKEIGIEWMDGIPLTINQIKTFIKLNNIEYLLTDLTNKGYLKLEYPKKKIKKKNKNGKIIERREYDTTKQKGYNIVTGKLSFEYSKILSPNEIIPTLVATDIEKIGVIDNKNIRKLTLKEGLKLFGYPENYDLSIFNNNKTRRRKAYDLLGNTVAIPVIKELSIKLLKY